MANHYVDYWLDLVYRRRATLLLVVGVVMTLVVVVTLVWPPVYKSHAEILVQDNRAQLLVSPGLQTSSPQNPAVVSNPVSQQDLNSEVQLLTSPYLVRRAIASLPVPHNGGGHFVKSLFSTALDIPLIGYRSLHGIPAASAKDEWALKLAHHLSAWVINRSNVIDVDFESHDAQWSHAFLKRLIDQYLAYHARISHDPEAAAFFRKQSAALCAQLDQAENRLNAYETKTGIIDINNQRAALVDQLSKLQLQYSQNAAELSATKQQVAELRTELRATPDRIEEKVSSVQNLALQKIKPEVMTLKAKRAELLTRYLPTSMRIHELDAEIAAAQAILNREKHLVIKERSTDLNPVWVSLDTNLNQAKTSAASLGAGSDALAKQIAGTKEQLATMANAGLEIERLERDVAAKKQTYLSYLRKAEEARAAEQLNNQQILNVGIAQEPSLPVEPAFPKVWLNLVIGSLLALALGLAAVYLEEKSDSKLYSSVEISKASGLSTVAVLRDAQ